MTSSKKEKSNSKLLPVLTVGISAFMSFFNLGHWFLVSVLGRTDLYTFGEQASKPYFYRRADLFAMVHLYWAYLFLAVLFLALLALWSKKRIILMLVLSLCVLALIAYLYHGTLGVE